MERINEKKMANLPVSSDRLQTILNQLENPNAIESRGEFVPTFKEDMFEQLPEQIPLRKEFTENVPPSVPIPMPIKAEQNSTTKIARPRLFDYEPVPIPNLDQHLSLR